MHNISISPEITARLRSWRERDHLFEDLDPARTAHIVIDLQNGFMAPGALVEISTAREVVPNVNRISAALREAGGTNIFISWTILEVDHANWSTWYSKFASEDRAQAMYDTFAKGAEGNKLWPGLDIQPEDLTVDKGRFSAFVPGTSQLPDILKARGVDTLIITGTATNVCCESNARDAMQQNYQVIFVADATAAASDAEHNSALDNLAMFADIMTTEEVIFFLNEAAALRSKAAE